MLLSSMWLLKTHCLLCSIPPAMTDCHFWNVISASHIGSRTHKNQHKAFHKASLQPFSMALTPSALGCAQASSNSKTLSAPYGKHSYVCWEQEEESIKDAESKESRERRGELRASFHCAQTPSIRQFPALLVSWRNPPAPECYPVWILCSLLTAGPFPSLLPLPNHLTWLPESRGTQVLCFNGWAPSLTASFPVGMGRESNEASRSEFPKKQTCSRIQAPCQVGNKSNSFQQHVGKCKRVCWRLVQKLGNRERGNLAALLYPWA